MGKLLTVWKLGSLEYDIWPTDDEIKEFTEALEQSPDNLVTTPDIDVIQVYIGDPYENCVVGPYTTINPSERKRVTVWTLGSLEHKILPTQEAITKFQDLLATDPDHIVWGPDLSVTQIEVDIIPDEAADV